MHVYVYMHMYVQYLPRSEIQSNFLLNVIQYISQDNLQQLQHYSLQQLHYMLSNTNR